MSTTRVSLEPAFVLHTRPYSNTSLVVELFSQTHGRIPVLARSARGPKSRFAGRIQLFSPMLVSWAGKGELKSLSQLELNGMPYSIAGQALMCCFYLNEVLLRLLQREDPYPQLFLIYQSTLQQLADGADVLVTLRLFEKRLLERLGYGLALQNDAQSGAPIADNCFYQYLPQRGFVQIEADLEGGSIFSGRSILALAAEKLQDGDVLRDAKRLLRMVLALHLGSKPLKSRELLV